MHELSICNSLIAQVTKLADQHQAHAVSLIRLSIGPLSGVEIPLLQNAFPSSSKDTIASGATLEIKATPLRVRCETCGTTSDASLNNLRCRQCDDWHTQLISGDEILLDSVELVS